MTALAIGSGRTRTQCNGTRTRDLVRDRVWLMSRSLLMSSTSTAIAEYEYEYERWQRRWGYWVIERR